MSSFVPSWSDALTLINQNKRVILIKREYRAYKYIIVKIRLICDEGTSIETIELSESVIKITKTELNRPDGENTNNMDSYMLEDGPWTLDLVTKKHLGSKDSLKEFQEQNSNLYHMKLSNLALIFQYLGSYLASMEGNDIDIFEQEDINGTTILLPKNDGTPMDTILQQIKTKIEQELSHI